MVWEEGARERERKGRCSREEPQECLPFCLGKRARPPLNPIPGIRLDARFVAADQSLSVSQERCRLLAVSSYCDNPVVMQGRATAAMLSEPSGRAAAMALNESDSPRLFSHKRTLSASLRRGTYALNFRHTVLGSPRSLSFLNAECGMREWLCCPEEEMRRLTAKLIRCQRQALKTPCAWPLIVQG